MSELEIPKNTSRKRTSTDAIREGGESRKRACGTAKKGATDDDVAEDEAVARELFMVSFIYTPQISKHTPLNPIP